MPIYVKVLTSLFDHDTAIGFSADKEVANAFVPPAPIEPAKVRPWPAAGTMVKELDLEGEPSDEVFLLRDGGYEYGSFIKAFSTRALAEAHMQSLRDQGQVRWINDTRCGLTPKIETPMLVRCPALPAMEIQVEI